MTAQLEQLPAGGVTTPRGFVAAASANGMKRSGKPDLALLVSEHDCSAAGVFTRNALPASPVILDRETLSRNPDRIRAVVANSGVANACTGAAGLQAAREMQRLTAEQLGCEPGQVLVLSTGVIGTQLDLSKIERGIRRCAANLAPEHGLAAAQAIRTTDTRTKQFAVRFESPAGTVTIGGMAKGSGMIHPDMATMLAVLTTDASVPSAVLQQRLVDSVNRSFNRISVDGDTSTNDTVLLLANGASGVKLEGEAGLELFSRALDQVCLALAREIVQDGEGASKAVTVSVTGAPDEPSALRVAQTIATSALVKTALAGGDPNWGRVLAAAGRSGIQLEPDRLALWVGDGARELQLVEGGVSNGSDEQAAAAAFAGRQVTLRLDLGLGSASATMWTCDLTHEYVSINANYRS